MWCTAISPQSGGSRMMIDSVDFTISTDVDAKEGFDSAAATRSVSNRTRYGAEHDIVCKYECLQRDDTSSCETDYESEIESREGDNYSYSQIGSRPETPTMTIDHERIRSKAYSLLLASPRSVKVNQFTRTFEEEGLCGVSAGILQALSSAAVQFIYELANPMSLSNSHDRDDKNLIALQFTNTLAGLALRVFGVIQLNFHH